MKTQIPRAQDIKDMLQAAYDEYSTKVQEDQSKTIVKELTFRSNNASQAIRTAAKLNQAEEMCRKFDACVRLSQCMHPAIVKELEEAGYYVVRENASFYDYESSLVFNYRISIKSMP